LTNYALITSLDLQTVALSKELLFLNLSEENVSSRRDVHIGGRDESVGGERGAGGGLCMVQCRNVTSLLL